MTGFSRVNFDRLGAIDFVETDSETPNILVRPTLFVKTGQHARFTGNNIFVTDTDGQLLFHYRLEENAFVLQELADEG